MNRPPPRRIKGLAKALLAFSLTGLLGGAVLGIAAPQLLGQDPQGGLRDSSSIVGLAALPDRLHLGGFGDRGVQAATERDGAAVARARPPATRGVDADAVTAALRAADSIVPADARRLGRIATVAGEIAPKSIVASQHGLFFAQNMMYRHSITVYDRSHTLVATLSDTVRLTEFGFEGPEELLRGAPVEAAFSHDGAHAWVSNYRMHGPGFEHGGTDTCSPEDGYDDSLLYRIDTATLEIDAVVPVGAVPKYVAVTPDDETVLVTNWCSYDVSIIDAATATERHRVPIGAYPRGVAVSADSSTAYIAVMGTRDIVVLDLDDRSMGSLPDIGQGPRHLVLDPDGQALYATLNIEGVVARIDLDTREVRKVDTGQAPRSMVISPDGRALYVVNYHSSTLTKVATEDMSVLETVEVDPQPIGITYDDDTHEVWVAHYSGTIAVFADLPVADG